MLRTSLKQLHGRRQRCTTSAPEPYGVTMGAWVSLLMVGVTVGSFPVGAKPQQSVAEYCDRAQKLLVVRKFEDARDAALYALHIDSHSAEAECLLGMAEFGLGNFAAAARDLQKALEADPGLLPAHRTLGQTYLNQKRLNDAGRQFELVLVSQPNDFEALYGLGLTFLLQNDPGSAENEFEKAAKAKPGEPSLLASLLQAQLELKQDRQAAATLALLDALFDKQDSGRTDLAAMLVNEGAYNLAIEQFQRMLEVQPESYELNYNLALAYHRAAKEDQAAALLTRLIELKENAELQNLLGDVEQSRGNKPRSRAAFFRAAELDPQNEEYRYDYAQSLVASSLLKEALEAFKKATQDFPGAVRMWLGWGATCYLTGDYAGAARTLLQAADVAPQDPHVYYLLGRAFDAAGTLQDTIERRFSEYLASRPNDAWAEYLYGKILATRGQQLPSGNLSQARLHLERAIALDGRLSEAHAELGTVFEFANQLGPAREELERAIALDPKSSSAFYKLADVYRRTGEPERQRKALERFQELKANERADEDRNAMRRFFKPSGD